MNESKILASQEPFRSLLAENFLDHGKIPWLWKNSLFGWNFLDCGKFSWLSKTYFLKCRKITGLIILKTNAESRTEP